jgi:hypothetical protein
VFHQSIYLVLIETSGNQRTIFQTNRLSENVGASELIYRVGTQYLLEALPRRLLGGWKPRELAARPADLAVWLMGQPQSIFESGENVDYEVMLAASGKAIVLTRGRERARALVSEVTRQALYHSPGVATRGKIVPLGEDSAEALHAAVKLAHEQIEALRGHIPAPEARFPRLPLTENCRSSGLPAARIDWKSPRGPEPVSEVVWAKRRARQDGEDRIKRVIPGLGKREDLDSIVDEVPMIGVVHADGNGLGEVFLNFDHYAYARDDRSRAAATAADYVASYRAFSIAIDRAARSAAAKAVKQTWAEKLDDRKLPIIPVIMGGDDLTAVCEGGAAIDFAAAYIRAFEDLTAQDDVIQAVIGQPIAAAAGVAIVKPHFPFHRAYDLSEELCKSAKITKKIIKDSENNTIPCSALDFQVLFDSSGGQLKPVRNRMAASDNSRLYARPYVVTPPARWAGATADARAWAEARLFDQADGKPALSEAADALARKGDEDNALPRSQLQALLGALDSGADAVDAQFQLIRHRYDCPWSVVTDDEKRLFFDEPDIAEERIVKRTRLLDAMELADLRSEA